MGSFFSFDKMITPMIIKLFFFLGILGSIISGVFMIGFGMISKSGSFLQVIIGIVVIFLGPLLIRIYFEMLIVVFKMQESLVQVRDFLFEQNNYNRNNNESA